MFRRTLPSFTMPHRPFTDLRETDRRRSAAVALLAATLLLVGCATVEPGGGFDAVQSTVAERTGLRVVWDVGSPEDESVRAEVNRLLAGELDEASVVQIALLNNRGLRALYEDLTVAQADLVQAGLLSNPVFDAGVLIPDGGGQIGLAFAVTQNFIELFQLPLRKGRAEAEYEAAKLRVADAVLGHANLTRRAYHQLVAAERIVHLGGESRDAAEAAAELGRRLRASGNVTAIELTQIEGDAVDVLLSISDAESDAIALRERLNAAMGLVGPRLEWRLAPLSTAPTGTVAAPAELERIAVERNLALAELQFEIEAASRTLGIEKPSALLEGLAFGVGIERGFGDPWQIGPAVSVPIPIFDQGQARIATAEAALRASLERFAAIAIETRAAARAAGAIATLDAERCRQVQERLVPLRTQAFDESKQRFDSGQITSFDLLLARQARLAAQRIEAEALRDAWLARSDLDSILAGHVGTDVAEGFSAGSVGVR